MSTRSVTIFMDGNEELCRIYRQSDGYPAGMGADLARLCDRRLTNGITHFGRDAASYDEANGMPELAALVLCALKNENPVGNIYMQKPNGDVGDWVEYVYVVRGHEGQKPVIECATHPGEWPFNMQAEDTHVFTGNSQQWEQFLAKQDA